MPRSHSASRARATVSPRRASASIDVSPSDTKPGLPDPLLLLSRNPSRRTSDGGCCRHFQATDVGIAASGMLLLSPTPPATAQARLAIRARQGPCSPCLSPVRRRAREGRCWLAVGGRIRPQAAERPACMITTQARRDAGKTRPGQPQWSSEMIACMMHACMRAQACVPESLGPRRVD